MIATDERTDVVTLLTSVARALRLGAEATAEALTEAGLRATYEPSGRYRNAGRPDILHHNGGLFLRVDGIGSLYLPGEAWAREGTLEIPVEVVRQEAKDRIRHQLSAGFVTPQSFRPKLPPEVTAFALRAPEDLEDIRAVVVDTSACILQTDPETGLQVKLRRPGAASTGEIPCDEGDAARFVAEITIRTLGLRAVTPEEAETERAEAREGAARVLSRILG